MRKFGWAPSIVPNGDDQNVYLVVDDLGRFGRVWREAEVDHPDLETVIEDLLASEYSNPIGVFGFNILEGRSCDVSTDVAHELRRRYDMQRQDVPSTIQDFVERHENRGGRQLSLRLAR